jgi:transposase
MRISTGDFAQNPQCAGHRSDQDLPVLREDLPEDARLYLRHVEDGVTIRALARETGCHASTILRRIRRFEAKRDDPLVDAALSGAARLSQRADERQVLKLLRRLAESGAVMAVMDGKEKAVIARKDVCTATLERRQAEAMALRGWVSLMPGGGGSLRRYLLTARGRAALRNMTLAAAGTGEALPRCAEYDTGRPVSVTEGMAESGAAYAVDDRRKVWETRTIEDPDDGSTRQMQFNMAESPLLLLARRRDGKGAPFLTPGMVAAGERLREDFELAQMGPRITQNWEGFLTAGIDQSAQGGSFGGGSGAARNRVGAALRALGPGLGDVALRVCCFLEGFEMTERRLGWPARSGKVVLRLALQRLELHYQDAYGLGSPLIG